MLPMVDKNSLFKKEASMLARVRVSRVVGGWQDLVAISVCMYTIHDSCDGAKNRCVLSKVSELVVTVKI